MLEDFVPEKLNDESIAGWLHGRQGWKRKDDALSKVYSFDSFRNVIVFVNRVASLSDDIDHHPDIDIRSNKVRLSLSTREAGGITDKDLDLAERVDFATSAG
jgi:4a-hydroxytetrahydrobiopterin dehydratase